MSPEARVELVNLAEQIVLDVIRQEPFIPFHRDKLGQSIGTDWSRKVLRDEPLSDDTQVALFEEAAKRVETQVPAAVFRVKRFTNSGAFWGVDISLRPGREWLDVLREVHGPDEPRPAQVLTWAAQTLVAGIQDGEFKRFTSKLSVRRRMHLTGFSGFDETLAELRLKRGLEIEVDTRTETTGKRPRDLVRFHVVHQVKDYVLTCPEAPNPVFEFDGPKAGVHREFRRFLQQQLVRLKPPESHPLCLWTFGSLKDLRHALPNWEPPATALSDLLNGCVVHPDVQIVSDLGHRSYFWTVGFTVRRPWSDLLPEIKRSLEAPDTVSRFRISAEAANLLRWVLDTPREAQLLGCTPLVEEAIRARHLRLGAEWPDENLPGLMDVLCEEITRRTPYALRPVPWRTPYGTKTRIHVAAEAEPVDWLGDVLKILSGYGYTGSREDVRRHLVRSWLKAAIPLELGCADEGAKTVALDGALEILIGSMSYENDRAYTEAYLAWVKSLPKSERLCLAAKGLDQPDASRKTSSAAHEQTFRRAAARDARPDEAAEASETSSSLGPQSSTQVADALAAFAARVRSHPNPLLALDTLCFATGLMGLEGRSQAELAKRHQVTRAAFSKMVVMWIDLFDLTPPRGCRSLRARRAYSLSRKAFLEQQRRRSSL